MKAKATEIWQRLGGGLSAVREKLSDKAGQGTAEYAILVGVLVMIAIGAIILLGPVLDDLWNQIQGGVEELASDSEVYRGSIS